MVSTYSTRLETTSEDNTIQLKFFQEDSIIKILFTNNNKVKKRLVYGNNEVDKIDIIDRANSGSVKISSQSRFRMVKFKIFV